MSGENPVERSREIPFAECSEPRGIERKQSIYHYKQPPWNAAIMDLTKKQFG